MPENTATMTAKQGKVVQIIGVVVDVEFEDHLPAIHNALEVRFRNKTLVLEVAAHLSKSSVRTVAMGPTDGLSRGFVAQDSGIGSIACQPLWRVIPSLVARLACVLFLIGLK